MVADEPAWLRWLLISLAAMTVLWLIVVPLAYVFVEALTPGVQVYLKNLWSDEDTRHSILLTLTVAPLAVVCNTIFGVAAAWAITKFRFPGRTLLVTMLDLPFAISPVVAGLMFVLIFGQEGYLGPQLMERGIKILFAWPGLVLATTFVTMPFVARELIPLMEAIGSEEELAAISLGANPWQMFWRVTLPNIKWGLLYGVIQCNARAIGEYGAVYVVSGRIAGETDTMPLRIEKLSQEYNDPGMYAVASLLAFMAVVTLAGKMILERWTAADLTPDEATAITKETHP